jgi:hypothetical protein
LQRWCFGDRALLDLLFEVRLSVILMRLITKSCRARAVSVMTV